MISPVAVASHNVGFSKNDTATELGNGTLSNSEVERSGEPAVVGHDLARSNATARWAFDYGAGSTAYDYVGSNDATITGATWTTGVSGNSLDFDGTDDYVEVSNNGLSRDTNFTIAAWVNVSDLSQRGHIYGRYDGSDDLLEVFFTESSNSIKANIGHAGGGSQTSVTSDPISADTWHHIAVTWDTSTDTLTIYVDGEPEASTTNTPDDFATNGNVRIGERSDGTGDLAGRIDDPRVYTSALTPGEIRRLHDAPSAKQSSTATERWAFDNGSGTVAYGDEGNDGTLKGNPNWTDGRSGNAIEFDGNDNYVDIADPGLSNSSDFTITTWFKVNEFGGEFTGLYDGADDIFEFGTTSGTTQIKYRLGHIGGAEIDQSGGVGGTLNTGEWYHGALVWDASGNQATVYVNATSFDSTTADIDNPFDDPGVEVLDIGRRSDDKKYHNGSLDDVRIFSKALTQHQIQYLYNHPGAQLNETSQYNASHSVTNSVEGFANLTLHNASANVTWKTGGGTTLSTADYTTSGNKTQSWSESSVDTVTVNVTYEPTHPDHYARLDDEGVLAKTYDPAVDNSSASPDSTTSTIGSIPVTLSVDVSDVDFGANGDDLTAEFFVNGSSIGSDSLSSNGTATISHDPTGGPHQWHVEVTDDYGHTTTSETFYFVAPGEVEIRNELEDHELINQSTGVEVLQFGDNETLDKLNVTDGNISVTGLPLDEEYVFVVNPEGYHQRSSLIVDLTEQSTIFMVNESESTIQNTIAVEDRTGFLSGNGSIIIEKSINRSIYDGTASTEYQWTAIAGDRLGADKEYTTDLIEGDRYRIIVRNEDGDQRILGEYTAKLNGTANLNIESTGVDLDEMSASVVYGATIDKDDNNVVVEYNDTGDQTGDLELVVWERGDPGNEIENTTVSGPHGGFVYNVPISASQTNKTFMVSLEGSRSDSDDIDLQFSTGVERKSPFSQIPSLWLHVGVFAGSLIAPAMLGGHRSEVGAIVATVVVGLGWWLNAVPDSVGALAIVLAMIVAAALKVATKGGQPVQ